MKPVDTVSGLSRGYIINKHAYEVGSKPWSALCNL